MLFASDLTWFLALWSFLQSCVVAVEERDLAQEIWDDIESASTCAACEVHLVILINKAAAEHFESLRYSFNRSI